MTTTRRGTPAVYAATAIAIVAVVLAASLASAAPEQRGPDVLISSVVKSRDADIASLAVEVYNPSCFDVHTRKIGIELALVYCSEDGEAPCATRQASLHGAIPKLQTLVACSTTNPAARPRKASSEAGATAMAGAEASDKCDLVLPSSLLALERDAEKKLVEVKLVRANATHAIDRVRDPEAFASDAFTLKKFSEFSADDMARNQPLAPKKNQKQKRREVNSVWLYKPYDTRALLGCHSTKHETLCESAVPEICPPADLDAFRALAIDEIRDTVRCPDSAAKAPEPEGGHPSRGEGSGSATATANAGTATSCSPASGIHGETVSTFGFLAHKVKWTTPSDHWWLLTLTNDGSTLGTDRGANATSLRIAVRVPLQEDATKLRAAWMDGLAVGSKVSLVGRVGRDSYGVVLTDVLRLENLGGIRAAEKIMPSPVTNATAAAAPASPEPGLVSTLSVVAIAMCCVFAMILLGLGLLVQYKKHVNPRSLIQGKMKTSLV